jgi:hypothetical protein
MSNSPRSATLSPFRFKDLPPELRNMVYSYIVGKNSDRPTLVFDAAELRYRIPNFNDTEQLTANTALLHVDQQIKYEALAVLYKHNTFYALLGEVNYAFDVVPYEEGMVTHSALPYGWDLSRIEHLCIDVELAYGNASNFTVDTLQSVCLSSLLRMTGLRSLRFFIVTNAETLAGTPPMYNDLLHDGGKMPYGTVWYRQVMRNLITVVPKGVDVLLGLGETEDQLKYYEAGQVGWDVRPLWEDNQWAYVPKEFLEKTWEEFGVLRGADAGSWMEG